MKWFKHDSDASMDAKLKKLRIKYGMEGYGLYWFCLELISANVEASNLTFELEHDAEVLSHDTGIHHERVQEMMTYMVNLGLFENRDGVITCLKLAKRLDQSMTSNPVMRDSIKTITYRKNHDSIMTKSDLVMQEQNRREQKRTEEKKKETSRFAPPSIEEITSHCRERKNGIDPEAFLSFYQSKNWMIGKNKMQDWKSAVVTWEKRNKDQPKKTNPFAGAI